jgi:uncharacterized membrane protein YfcA
VSDALLEFFRLAPLGFFVGAYGTLVGAGGGSILVPVLLWMLPDESAASITAISLAVVFFNAYSGTIAYVRMGRIDYYAGILFSLSGAPGAVLGALLVRQVSRGLFEPLFGVLLIAIGGFLVYDPLGAHPREDVDHPEPANDRMRVGAIGSAYIAIVSSLLGIGGGIIHVPFLIRVLRMPPHAATATSHFVLTFMALTATATHVVLGEFHTGINRTMYLAVGVMMGAPLGAALSAKVRGSLIVRLLAGALCLVGLRLLLSLA